MAIKIKIGKSKNKKKEDSILIKELWDLRSVLTLNQEFYFREFKKQFELTGNISKKQRAILNSILKKAERQRLL